MKKTVSEPFKHNRNALWETFIALHDDFGPYNVQILSSGAAQFVLMGLGLFRREKMCYKCIFMATIQGPGFVRSKTKGWSKPSLVLFK